MIQITANHWTSTINEYEAILNPLPSPHQRQTDTHQVHLRHIMENSKNHPIFLSADTPINHLTQRPYMQSNKNLQTYANTRKHLKGFGTEWYISQGSHLHEKNVFFTQKKSRLCKSENAVRLLYAKNSDLTHQNAFSLFVFCTQQRRFVEHLPWV